MTNIFPKTFLLIIAICCFATVSKAQVGYNFSQYDIGVAGSANQVMGDVITTKMTSAVAFNFNYNQTPYLSFILEGQAGKLAGGDAVKDKLGRAFRGDYSAFLARAELQFGEVVDYSQSPFNNALKNLYVSTGMGLLVDHITQINRYSSQNFFTPGVNNSNEIFIPARIGYEFKLYNEYNQPSVRIDLAYQYNFMMSDELDGFVAGNNKDKYTQLSLGVKFAIGGLSSYRKQIEY